MHFKSNRHGSRYGSQNRSNHSFSRGRNNQPKPLEHHVFIKKASSSPQESQIQTNSQFLDFDFIDILKKNIVDHGYKTPSPIQDQSIPHILQGRDVIGIANTGTGKTAAFLLPLIQKIYQHPQERALIVTPTRELALQIVDELHAFARGTNIAAVLCIGGTSISNQERQIRRTPQIVIGTPGRLKDLVRRRSIDFSQFHNVVLDEVDRMVDIGFINDIRYLISLLPEERQSLFFSATVTEKVKGILHEFVRNPVTVSVKKQETSGNIDQDIIKVKDREQKIYVLQDLLRKEGFNKVLVFGRTKWGIEKLSKALDRNGFKVAAIHGNKSQGQRQRALQLFKQNQLQVLLATDVASRGLDIDNVTHVINYDAPTSYEDYIHRIGRTGRADNKGTALTFVE